MVVHIAVAVSRLFNFFPFFPSNAVNDDGSEPCFLCGVARHNLFVDFLCLFDCLHCSLVEFARHAVCSDAIVARLDAPCFDCDGDSDRDGDGRQHDCVASNTAASVASSNS